MGSNVWIILVFAIITVLVILICSLNVFFFFKEKNRCFLFQELRQLKKNHLI